MEQAINSQANSVCRKASRAPTVRAVHAPDRARAASLQYSSAVLRLAIRFRATPERGVSAFGGAQPLFSWSGFASLPNRRLRRWPRAPTSAAAAAPCWRSTRPALPRTRQRPSRRQGAAIPCPTLLAPGPAFDRYCLERSPSIISTPGNARAMVPQACDCGHEMDMGAPAEIANLKPR